MSIKFNRVIPKLCTSSWIEEIRWIPNKNSQENQYGITGMIIVKFRPYFNQASGILYTYSPSIMINKSEYFFYQFINAVSLGSFYLKEKKVRDKIIGKHFKEIVHAPLTKNRQNNILSYNSQIKGIKYHYLQKTKTNLFSKSGNLLKTPKLNNKRSKNAR